MLAPAAVDADSWPGSRPQAYTSASGGHRFKTRPPQLSTWSGKSHGTLVATTPAGGETELWSRDLVNIPVTAYVSDSGAWVVTMDTWARLGYEHALVIYDRHGAVVADYDLDALLTPQEIASHVVHTMNARRWRQDARIAFGPGERDIVITLHWGRTIRVALATGAIEPGR